MGLTFFLGRGRFLCGEGIWRVFVWGGYIMMGGVEKRAFQKFGMGIKARRADGNPSLW